MPNEPTPDPAREYDERERDLLFLLTDGEQPVWSVDDLARSMDDHCAIDYVTGLHRAGLIHRIGDFVFASRAGVRATAIIGHVV